MVETSQSKHVIELAKEIMDDIELSKHDSVVLLLKATRLARFVHNDEMRDWLKLEMQGYAGNMATETAKKYLAATGRKSQIDGVPSPLIPLTEVEAKIIADNARLAQLRIPDISAASAVTIIHNIRVDIQNVSGSIAKMSGIRGRVISLLHDFATQIYYEKTFDNLAESIFDKYKKRLTCLLLKT